MWDSFASKHILPEQKLNIIHIGFSILCIFASNEIKEKKSPTDYFQIGLSQGIISILT